MFTHFIWSYTLYVETLCMFWGFGTSVLDGGGDAVRRTQLLDPRHMVVLGGGGGPTVEQNGPLVVLWGEALSYERWTWYSQVQKVRTTSSTAVDAVQ